ncbi:MAG TPA: hypothetical protein VFW87_19855, partial [Pirellulales bacterium]|nr:hypothetical protein [Pirellulales bacterium]
ERQTVFQWHGDTFDLPAGAARLARGTTCENQAFRHGAAYGLQFHPEMTAEMVESWLAEPNMCAEAASCPHVDPAEIRRRAPAALREMAPFSEQICRRFAARCAHLS